MAKSLALHPSGEARMPTYDYDCGRCGPFSENRPMAEFDRAQPCPGCGDPAPRSLTLPAIGGGATEAPSATTPFRSHAGGCSCCSAPRRFAAEAV
ncbi:MAG TPA: FmdB family zinc ribbon protein [Acetobacteraceae bacterium]|jgi:putative FmdB family regulatory protein|nr:FmdB family zinc ribbon protein [Acetobacteraceae bacterium]